jgi:hypothetical protein
MEIAGRDTYKPNRLPISIPARSFPVLSFPTKPNRLARGTVGPAGAMGVNPCRPGYYCGVNAAVSSLRAVLCSLRVMDGGQ